MDTLKLPKKRVMKAQASLWKRVVAFFMDLIILEFIVFSPFSQFFLSLEPQAQAILSGQATLPGWFFAVMFIIGLLALSYFTLLEYLLGSTPGMRIMNIRFEGKRTFMNCLIRNLFIIPIFPFTLLWIVEPLYLILRKERLLEKLTKTKTIETLLM